MKLRNFAFDQGLLLVRGPNVPVVSVGNLSAGGTGKTPIVSLLVSGLASRGSKVGVVSRGYGGETKESTRVPSDGSPSSAARYGDEPTWLANRHPDVPVYVGADRAEAAQKLTEENQVDLVVADDAFQHRYLRREADVVLVDASQPAWHYRSLPFGRLREDFSALRRARYVFLTKTNLASVNELKWLRHRVDAEKSKARFDVYEFEWALAGFVPLASPTSTPSLLKQAKVLLVSGIARGNAFKDLVASTIGTAPLAGHIEFNDHHRYSQTDLARIESEAERLGVDAIVVTEKDAVKLGSWQPKTACLVSRLTARPTGDFEKVYEEIRRLGR